MGALIIREVLFCAYLMEPFFETPKYIEACTDHAQMAGGSVLHQLSRHALLAHCSQVVDVQRLGPT